jgi:predicted RNA-binding protein with PIN domain
MYYCIDGYNLLFALGLDLPNNPSKPLLPSSKKRPLTPAPLHAARNHLIDQLRHHAQRLSLNILLVFDGNASWHPYYPPPLQTRATLKVVYTQDDTSADEYLIAYGERHRTNPLCFITNDQLILSHVCGLGFSSQPPNLFWNRILDQLSDTNLTDAAPLPLSSYPSNALYEQIFLERLDQGSSDFTPFHTTKTSLTAPPPQSKKEPKSIPMSNQEERWLQLFQERLSSPSR